MKTLKLTPNLAVEDIKETVHFYNDILGFELTMAVPSTQDGIEKKLEDKDYVYALVKKDNIEIMFQQEQSLKNDVVFLEQEILGASISFYIEVEAIDKFYANFKDQPIEITEIKTSWYGMREFYIKDNNGYVLGFAEKVLQK